MIKKVFIFGFGYTAKVLSKLLIANNYKVCGTSRNPDIRRDAKKHNITLCDFNSDSIESLLSESKVILICTPPNDNYKDPVFANFKKYLILNKDNIKWLGYLSTTGVYGNHNGEWVTEDSECLAKSERAKVRIIAEQQWLSLYNDYSIAVHIFRLAGIYGPSRSSIDRIKAGKDYSILKPGHFFSRIHVDDIARILLASIKQPTAGEVYNLCDDEPSPSHIVDQYAASLLGTKTPKLIPYEKADLSPMALEFYQSNKRVSNAKIKQKLSLDLLYSSYREGLISIIKNLI